MTERLVFELTLSELTLEGGARLPWRRVRGWAWGPTGTLEHLQRCGARILQREEEIPTHEQVIPGRTEPPPPPADASPPAAPWPTIAIVHALTGDMRAGGPGGWWSPVIGPGQALDPGTHLLLCFNNLGSCYGTSGPADAEFPRRQDDPTPTPPTPERGGFELPDDLPATLTSWDQARTHLDALSALGVHEIELLTGGSVGGSQVLCMAMLEPTRILRLAPFATHLRASAWILAWNHLSRQALLATPGDRGLSIARQIAHASYRAPAGMDLRQGRGMFSADPDAAWSSKGLYHAQTYLQYQGDKFVQRYTSGAYLAALDAMDHHDLFRVPPGFDEDGWGPSRITASTLIVTIDSDALFVPAEGAALCKQLGAQHFEIHSPHGHDAFLIEWEQVREALRIARSLPPQPPSRPQ